MSAKTKLCNVTEEIRVTRLHHSQFRAAYTELMGRVIDAFLQNLVSVRIAPRTVTVEFVVFEGDDVPALRAAARAAIPDCLDLVRSFGPLEAGSGEGRPAPGPY